MLLFQGVRLTLEFEVRFDPFTISSRLASVHVFFPQGDTGFASTGTHLVERSGRLSALVLLQVGWGGKPNDSGYVSGVDECPAA